MHFSARKAGEAYKDIVAGSFGFIIVWSKTLHSESRIRAAEDEWRHSAHAKGGPDHLKFNNDNTPELAFI
jgi:hypothetical protein